MKKLVIIVLFIILAKFTAAQNSHSNTQIDLMAGMGLTFVSTPTFNDYVNNLVPQGSKVQSLGSTVSFFFETDYSINKTFDIGIEYDNRLYSHTTNFSGLGIYEIDYNMHSPSLLVYYVVQGEGYKFKLGGGAGYRYLVVDEKLPGTRSREDFTASGFGALLKAQGHTLLSGNFYAYIGLDLRYDILGEAENDQRVLGSQALNQEVNFNTLGMGVKLGVSYFIR